MTPDTIISDIIRAEGSQYTNDSADRGGPTRWGITQATLSKSRGRSVTAEEVAGLSEDEARQIYRLMYWDQPGFSRLGVHSMKIAAEVMDTGVNCGPGQAARMLQRALNAMNDTGRLWPDLKVDGKCGPATAGALASYLRHRGAEGEWVLFVTLNGLQAAYYLTITESRPPNERFIYGWLRERVAHQLR
ncbi:MAG TPA: hypothetical protein DDZ92_07185 [Halomonas sp.]|nr:hypothetical protein [Halomonas sp.]